MCFQGGEQIAGRRGVASCNCCTARPNWTVSSKAWQKCDRQMKGRLTLETPRIIGPRSTAGDSKACISDVRRSYEGQGGGLTKIVLQLTVSPNPVVPQQRHSFPSSWNNEWISASLCLPRAPELQKSLGDATSRSRPSLTAHVETPCIEQPGQK